MMDATLWDEVVVDLAPDRRCIAPTLPLGAHRHPMRPDADLSPRGIARLIAEFLDRLELDDVTLVGNDTGGAFVQLLVRDGAARVGRIVLVSCEAFDNFPPGLTGKTLVLAGKLPSSLFGLLMQQMRFRPLRRLPMAFGWLTMRGDAATARWMTPILRQPEIRRTKPHARDSGTAAPLRRSGARRLGKPRPRHAARARTPPRGTAPAGTIRGGTRQLHTGSPGPAPRARSDHPGVPCA